MIEKRYQVTLYCTTNQYKPVSCIVIIKQEDNSNLLKQPNTKLEIINKGVQKICAKRYWTSKDLSKYHYTRVKARVVEE